MSTGLGFELDIAAQQIVHDDLAFARHGHAHDVRNPLREERLTIGWCEAQAAAVVRRRTLKHFLFFTHHASRRSGVQKHRNA